MTQRDGIGRLKAVLVVYSITHLFYGISFLLAPGYLISLSGSPDPVGLSWIRWTGGPLFALAIGGFQVYRKPQGQGLFMTIATASALLVGLGLLYSWIFDHSTSAAWFHLTPCVINLGLFALLIWARQGARAVLDR